MLIVEDYHGCYNDALEKNLNFNKNSEDNDGKVLFHGMGCIEKPHYKERYKNYSKKAFWNLEQPTAWYVGNPKSAYISANMDKYFDKIFTLCPYTVEWLNLIQKRNTFVPSYLPFNKEYVVKEKEEKIYDVIYWGHVSSQVHLNFIDAMKNFKYNFLSLGINYWDPRFRSSGYHKYITSINMPRHQMWDLLRKTKISLVTNHAYLTESHVENVKSIKNWQKCEAFSHLDKYCVPQYKTRMIESAVSRALMLVKRNPWNIGAKWFEPDKEFIYFDRDEELPSLIEHISSNWHQYEKIAENAFIKATTKYTVENFVNFVKENLDDE